jgi:hypothetical protein
MNERNSASISILAAGTATGLALTYLVRATRARLRKPITEATTILVPRDRAERFVESRERMIEALCSKRLLANIEQLELRDAPDGRGTEMHLSMRGVGKYAIDEILRRAKSMLEAGEIPTGRRFA